MDNQADSDQAWFWSDRWQSREREADCCRQWFASSLPSGLKLSSTGELSGTLNAALRARVSKQRESWWLAAIPATLTALEVCLPLQNS